MATSNDKQSTPPTTTKDATANAKRAEGDAPVTDATIVAPHEGTDHGYIGYVRDKTPNEQYTVTGVTQESGSKKS